ncbi:MAG: hypothetical protein ACWA5A_04325 [Marinibacterium sp.]
MTKTQALGVALVSWLGFIALLAFVPWLGAAQPDLPNVAAVLGYDIDLAYILVAGWAAFVILAVAFWQRRTRAEVGTDGAPARAIPALRRWIELAVVGGGALIAYWPFALARIGPSIEDVYFVNVLWRMQCGATPYTDFEFLYGPLMIGPLWLWIQSVGLSLTAYYTFYAVLQAGLAIAVMAILQAFLPRALPRYAAFAILLPMIFDLLYGLNWTAWRYFGIVFVLLLLAEDPIKPRRWMLAAIVTGVQAAYSYEFGIATGLSALTILVLEAFSRPTGRVVTAAVGYAAGSVAVWAGVAVAFAGAAFGDYLSLTGLVARSATDSGLGRFAFFWTVQSLALFLILSAVIPMAGVALARIGRATPRPGDRQLAGALVFALVTLKIALQRADYLHLVVPFVPLILVLLIHAPRQLALTTQWLQRLALGAIVVASLAHVVGYGPLGVGMINATKTGWRHILTDRPRIGPVEARQPTINDQRSYLNTDVRDLAARLATPEFAGRPVLFYRQTWDLPPKVGVCPEAYAFYDLLYSDSRAPLADLVAQTPELLVVLTEDDWVSLTQPALPLPDHLSDLTGLRRIAQIVGSGHYAQSPIENGAPGIEERMWRDAVGNDIVAAFSPAARLGRLMILERTGNADES